MKPLDWPRPRTGGGFSREELDVAQLPPSSRVARRVIACGVVLAALALVPGLEREEAAAGILAGAGLAPGRLTVKMARDVRAFSWSGNNARSPARDRQRARLGRAGRQGVLELRGALVLGGQEAGRQAEEEHDQQRPRAPA